jgi:hypothetical protein
MRGLTPNLAVFVFCCLVGCSGAPETPNVVVAPTVKPAPEAIAASEKTRDEVMAQHLRDMNDETQKSWHKTGKDAPKETIDFNKAMFDQEEHYRQAWLRTHNGKERAFEKSYPHGLNYFGENFAELLSLEKNEEWALERKRKGECIAQQPPFHLD